MADEDQVHPALSIPELSIPELQRLAFGRADSAAEHERANAALRQLQQLHADDIRLAESKLSAQETGVAADAAQHDASVPAPDVSDEAVVLSEADSDGAAPSSTVFDRPLSAFPRWLLPVVAIGLIAVGALGGVAASGSWAESLSATPTPPPMHFVEMSPAPVDDPGLPPVPPAGDIDAAVRWFVGKQTAQDTMPTPMDGMDPATTRLVFHAPGEDPWDAWVARSLGDSGFCLAVSHPRSGMGGSTCATPENFVLSGLAVVISDDSGPQSKVSVSWDGRGVTATRLQ